MRSRLHIESNERSPDRAAVPVFALPGGRLGGSGRRPIWPGPCIDQGAG